MSTTKPTTTEPTTSLDRLRPKRADAQRNYDKIIAAAREAFTERGASTSLEEIARRAHVGIGTLYRNFPSRQALLEAVYLDEVQALCRSAEDLTAQPPWEALAGWLRRFVAYMVTKQALATEMLDHIDRDAPLFTECRAALFAAGGPLLARAREAGAVRSDTDLAEIIQLFGQIAKIPAAQSQPVERILQVALDGLRYRASDAADAAPAAGAAG